jgi:hypothetical protein
MKRWRTSPSVSSTNCSKADLVDFKMPEARFRAGLLAVLEEDLRIEDEISNEAIARIDSYKREIHTVPTNGACSSNASSARSPSAAATYPETLPQGSLP